MRIIGLSFPAPSQWRNLLQVIPWMDSDEPVNVPSEDVIVKARVTFNNVQEHFKYMPDFGADTWELPRLCEDNKHYVGDCEDFVAKCFEGLVNNGVEVGALRFCICQTEAGEGHMVGVITTNEGLLILDQRKPTVEFSNHFYFDDYKFRIISCPGLSNWVVCA